jgi:hypothetical protein
MTLLDRYYNLSRFHLSLFIVFGNVILIWLSKSVLLNELVFYNTYSEQLTYDRAKQLFDSLRSISWVSYIVSPIILIIKFSLVSLVLYIGIIFNNLQYKVPLGSVFKVVIASEIVFLLASITKFFWFYLFAGNYDLHDISFYYPLSLTNIFKVEEVGKIWIYPMQSVNLFHIMYLMLLSYGLNNVCKIAKSDSDKIIMLSYLPGLVLWLTLIMFISIDTVS